eukprot:gnl/MRDRNA2_/MRDRNA2_118453_c0_seq1.p1 gnl/MRDRNA2_/MRDRNA2_118453_c0~~gnl/MRDRNA2_/MRDRNA2_118453_c0_seq1.p1  ORF type:complete len:489 (-),score=90.94 gnl/MRDRNA2_/MRDRNA2_118453_c0_seq1:268-1734(-)
MLKALSAFANRVRSSSVKTKNRASREVQGPNDRDRPAHVLVRMTSDITAKLQLMFPQLPQCTIDGVLTQLLKIYPNCSDNQLADLATSSLLEVQSMRVHRQSEITPATQADVIPGMVQDDSDNLASAAVRKLTEQSRVSRQNSFMRELDDGLAKLFMIPRTAMSTCVSELIRVLQQVASQPNGEYECKFAQYSSNSGFVQLVWQYQPVAALLCIAGFKEEFDRDGGKTLTFVGDKTSERLSAVLAALQRLTAEEFTMAPTDVDETCQLKVQDVDDIPSCESQDQVQDEQQDVALSFVHKPSRLPPLPPLSSHQTSLYVSPGKLYALKKQRSHRALRGAGEHRKDGSKNFESLLQNALYGTNLHRAKKGLAPLTSLHCSSEDTSMSSVYDDPNDARIGDAVTIPERNLTDPTLDDVLTDRPAVWTGNWTTQQASPKAPHSVPDVTSTNVFRAARTKENCRGVQDAKASAIRRKNRAGKFKASAGRDGKG